MIRKNRWNEPANGFNLESLVPGEGFSSGCLLVNSRQLTTNSTLTLALLLENVDSLLYIYPEPKVNSFHPPVSREKEINGHFLPRDPRFYLYRNVH